MGGGKTGSSALQVYFNVNKTLLLQNGISYEHAPPLKHITQITSGNGGILFEESRKSKKYIDNISDIILSYFKGTSRALCSSELLSSLDADAWKRIVNACSKLDIDPQVIMFVRDVVPYYISAYNQLVKRAGLHESFEESLSKDYYQYHSCSLRALIEAFRLDQIKVVHYDTNKSRLDAAFMNVIGIPFKTFLNDPLRRRVNRSLTAYEIKVLTKINSVFGEEFCTELSDMLIYDRPESERSYDISRECVRLLRNRHQHDVDWINKNFFNDMNILAIYRKNPLKGLTFQAPKAKADEYEEVNHIVINWMIRKLIHLRGQNADYILNKAQEIVISSKAPEQEEIPEDFDPFYYLVSNSDVLLAGMNPYEHFLHYGRGEGRPWTWKKHLSPP